MSEEKTEHPTAKKLKDAKKKGQIPRSRDLAIALASIAAVIALSQFGARLMEGMALELSRDLAHFGDAPTKTITAGDLNGILIKSLIALTMLVGPIAAATLVAGVGAQGLQGGWNFSFEALHLNWGKLNPVNGVKQFAPMRAGMDTLKTLVAVAVISWLGWGTLQAVLVDGPRMAYLTPYDAALLGWDYTRAFLWKVAIGLLALAMADYGLQYYRFISGLKMSKQEIRDESKQQDGSSEVKGKIRRIQRDMARRRMINDVSRATVVITNPTHFAVALEYRRGEMTAPVVIAKGADFIAAQIRERARKHGIPMVENKPLAQTLFKTAEVGQAIPSELFAAVAEVLAQLIRLKQLVM